MGATLKDMTLSFWEINDNFEFESGFSLGNWVSEYQTNIWYVEFLNNWITTDKTCALHAWDIETESKKFTATFSKIEGNIIDLIPIDVLRLVLVASMDNKITLIDFAKKETMAQVDVSEGGIHSMYWSTTYQVLLTAGWQQIVKVWKIDSAYLDNIDQIGELSGHYSVVTAVGGIKNTPMVMTADDSGVIKVWDIRTLKCLQTVPLLIKGTTTQFIDLYKHGKLGFIGTRVNYLEFDEANEIDAKKIEDEVWPLQVEYNLNCREIVVCTRKDVQIIDIDTGRVKRVYSGLLRNLEDDITAFKLVSKQKKFIVGDYKGNLVSYQYSTGERISLLVPHSNEVTNIKIDYANNLVISSSWDSVVQIQKEEKDTYFVRRRLENLHYNKTVSLMEVSVFHNLLLTATNNNIMYAWDYEFAKPIGIIETQEGSEFTCIQFINRYSILIIADTTGQIHFLHFSRNESSVINFEKIAFIQLDQEVNKEESPKTATTSTAATKIITTFQLDRSENNPFSSKMYISTNKGFVKSFDLKPLFQLPDVRIGLHSNTKASHNAERIAHDDFLTLIKTHDLKAFKLKIPHKNDSNSLIDLKKGICESFKAHRDALTTLDFIPLPKQKLLTGSLDSFVKIWTLEGQLLAALKVNNPLPVIWKLKQEFSVEMFRKKVLYAFKVIEVVRRNYLSQMTTLENDNSSIKEFLEEMVKPRSPIKKPDEIRSPRTLKLPNISKKKKVILMSDEYSPRDINFEKLKDLYRKELQGPNLKEIDFSKKLRSHNRNQSLPKEEMISLKLKKRMEADYEYQKEIDNFLDFLKDPLVKEPNVKGYSRTTQKLNEKLTKSIHVPSIYDPQNIKEFFNLTQLEDQRNLSSLLRRQIFQQVEPSEHSVFSQEPSQAKARRNQNPLQEEAYTNKKLLSRVELDSNKSMQSILKLPLTSRAFKPQLDNSSFLKSSRAQLPAQRLDPSPSFFSYATHRLNTEDDYSSINYSSASTNINSNIGNFERLQEKRKFDSIINKLSSNVKKSQGTGLSYRSKQFFSPSKEPGLETPCPEYNNPSERVYSLPAEETKTLHNETSKFLSELSQLRQATEESWSTNLSEFERRKKHLTEANHLIEQNTSGEVPLLSFRDNELKAVKAFEGLDNQFNIDVVKDYPRTKEGKASLKPISIPRSGR